MVACSVVWGLGSGGIDAGLNAYVSEALLRPARQLAPRLLQPRGHSGAAPDDRNGRRGSTPGGSATRSWQASSWR